MRGKESNKRARIKIPSNIAYNKYLVVLKIITVVSDAAMLSAENLHILEEEGFKFIAKSRLAKPATQ
jgi:hypothetical protein